MTAFDRLKSLCDSQGISINKLEEKLDLSRNTLYSWKKNTPKGSNLMKVADYFDVSTDYLLGRADTPDLTTNSSARKSSLDDDYHKIERFARKVNEKDRKKALLILEAAFEDAFEDEDDYEDENDNY